MTPILKTVARALAPGLFFLSVVLAPTTAKADKNKKNSSTPTSPWDLPSGKVTPAQLHPRTWWDKADPSGASRRGGGRHKKGDSSEKMKIVDVPQDGSSKGRKKGKKGKEDVAGNAPEVIDGDAQFAKQKGNPD